MLCLKVNIRLILFDSILNQDFDPYKLNILIKNQRYLLKYIIKEPETVTVDATQTVGETVSEAPEENKDLDEGEIEEREGEKADTMEVETADKKDEEESEPEYICTGLSQESSVTLLRACVNMIAVPVEPDALNAIMRLSLRLTRDFDLAAMFAELGGIKLLLGLKQTSSFTGFSSLASLLVRHVLEDRETLRHTMEKVIRASTLSNNAATTKEIHYLLRFLAPAACRNPEIFTGGSFYSFELEMSLNYYCRFRS